LRARNILVLLAVLVVLVGVYVFVGRPKPATAPPPNVYVWNIKQSELEHIIISLPREGKSRAFIKIAEKDKFPWHFDDSQRSPVDSKRWGGGIPLLLSGPAANRIIVENATNQQFTEYGLAKPSMEIILVLANKDSIKIEVGNCTPNNQNYYIRVPQSNTVALVDYTWYDVLKSIVTDPPYAHPGT
jgi:hypothetical protein